MKLFKVVLKGGVAVTALCLSSGVMAQGNSASVVDVENADENGDPIITVTGSRVAREGFEAPTPTTVLGEQLIEDSSQASVATTLNQLPTLGAGTNPSSAGNDVGTGTQGANFLNLRGLGTNRTLVLLDSRRVVASAASGQVDVNMLPTTLLKQVEVVTGGASAAWGSDALAGVVNFTLDKEFDGVKGGLRNGISGQGDGHEVNADLAFGTSFASGRGHVIASINYAEVKSIDRADSRDWFRGTKVVNNPAYAPGNGEPVRLVADNAQTFLGSDQGHVFFGPPPSLAGTSFNNDGTTGIFDFGTRTSNNFSLGSTTPNDLAARSQLRAGYEQLNGFFRASYDATDDLNVYGEFMYGKTKAQSLSVPYYRFAGAVRALPDNAFLPATLSNFFAANPGVANIPLALTNFQLGRATPTNDRELMRFVVGADYDFGDNWTVSAYYEHGSSDVHNEARNNAITANYALAVDAVFRNGPGSEIVCRSTLTNPNNGCVPLNVFGNGVASQAAIDYIIGTAVRDIKLKQDVAAITVSGDLFDLPAGPVSVAIGGEYREESVRTTADPISQTNGFWVGNYKAAQGSYDVKEAFGEIVVPVFQDSALGDSLDLNAAFRLTDYSTSGVVKTWKVGATYDIGAGLRVRGTLSRDIRAPNLNEYFDGGQTNSLFFDDPFITNGGVPLNYLVVRQLSGNVNLDPEKADSFNVGVVFQPDFIPGLRLAVDYVDIEINDAIGVVTDNDIPARCFAGEQAFCDLIVRSSTVNPGESVGRMTLVRNGPVNFQTQRMKAWDFEASYGFDLGNGQVDVRTLWTYTTDHFIEDAARGTTDTVLGEIAGGNAPGGATGPTKWKGFSSISYSSDGGLRVGLRHRYIGAGVLNANWVSGVDIDDNTVDSVNYFDLSLSQTITAGNGEFDVFANVDNIFDKAPPRAPLPAGPTLDSLGVSNSVHDLIGRYFRFGVRFEF